MLEGDNYQEMLAYVLQIERLKLRTKLYAYCTSVNLFIFPLRKKTYPNGSLIWEFSSIIEV